VSAWRMASLAGGAALCVGALSGLAPLAAVGVMFVLAAAGLAMFAPLRVLVPACMFVVSFVYVESAFSGEYVGDSSLAGRILRDGVLGVLAGGLAVRVGALGFRGRGVWLLCTLAGMAVVIAGFTTSTVTTFRYLAVLPALGWLVANRFTRAEGATRAVDTVARTLIFVAILSAAFGIAQTLGVAGPGIYDDYVQGGFTRSVGIVGQPNNQAFLLVLALLALRHTDVVKHRRGVGVLLGGATLATFSLSGCLALIALATQPARRRLGRRQRWRVPPEFRPVLRYGFVLAIGFVGLSLLQLRKSNIVQSVLADGRWSLASNALGQLDGLSWLLGDASLRRTIPVTDNGLVDLTVVGGLALLAGWVLFGVWAWHQAGRGSIGRAVLAVIGIYSVTASVFGLFPGIFYAWVLLFLDVGSPQTVSAASKSAQPADALVGT
jgi:hypothetical protein